MNLGPFVFCFFVFNIDEKYNLGFTLIYVIQKKCPLNETILEFM